MDQVPCSPHRKLGGMYYLPRMLEKIRLKHSGTLRTDLHENCGSGFDAMACRTLGLDYQDLCHQVVSGKTDEQIWQWTRETRHALEEMDIMMWNLFIAKVGWKDAFTELLESRKAESGLADRKDIETMFHYLDADEGRDISSGPF